MSANVAPKSSHAWLQSHPSPVNCPNSYCQSTSRQFTSAHHRLPADHAPYEPFTHTAAQRRRQSDQLLPFHYAPHAQPAYHEHHSFPNFSPHSTLCPPDRQRRPSVDIKPYIHSDGVCGPHQLGLASEAPERTRHISAPVLPPYTFSQPCNSVALKTVSSSFGPLWDSRPTNCFTSDRHGRNATPESIRGNYSASSHSNDTSDLTSSDAVAELLMQRCVLIYVPIPLYL